MQVSEVLYGAMTNMLRDRYRVADVDRVVAFEQDRRTVGTCETCSYTETIVTMTYQTTRGGTKTYEYKGDLGELIRALTD